MRISFGSVSREINCKPITLRNAESLKEWAEKCVAYAKQANEKEIGETFVQITKDYPELLRIIDVSGSFNAQALQQRLEDRRKQHARACEETGENVEFNEEEYRERILKEMQTELQAMIRDTPMIAKLLHFTTPKFPVDIQALQLGIECIKNVANPSDLQDVTEEEWLDVAATEVAAWIDNFCGKVVR